MDYTIIDAHAHLWLRQDTVVDGFPIRTLDKGRSLFMGEIRQMVPPFMMDGVNSAEVFLSNMDYAQVAAAVSTQEFIDGIQNEYLAKLEFMEDDKKYIDNIDNFYVKKAYSTIVAWFSRDGHDRYKGKIRDIFAMVPDDDEEQNDVRVIWYEISGKEAHRVFPDGFLNPGNWILR